MTVCDEAGEGVPRSRPQGLIGRQDRIVNVEENVHDAKNLAATAPRLQVGCHHGIALVRVAWRGPGT